MPSCVNSSGCVTTKESCGPVRTQGRLFMWQTTPFVDLLPTIKCMSTEMHHCMIGSSRRKLTKLSHNKVSFHRLNQLCDNQHEHEPWGQKPDGCWATAEETAYPWPLVARAIATQVVLELQTKGIECQLPSFAEQECTLQAMRALTSLQPRKNLPPLVPEFKQLIQQRLVTVAAPRTKAQHSQTGVCRECTREAYHGRSPFSPEEFMQEELRLQHPTEQLYLFPSPKKSEQTFLT